MNENYYYQEQLPHHDIFHHQRYMTLAWRFVITLNHQKSEFNKILSWAEMNSYIRRDQRVAVILFASPFQEQVTQNTKLINNNNYYYLSIIFLLLLDLDLLWKISKCPTKEQIGIISFYAWQEDDNAHLVKEMAPVSLEMKGSDFFQSL